MTPRPELTEERVNALERLAKRAFVEVEIEVLNGLIAYWREHEALANNLKTELAYVRLHPRKPEKDPICKHCGFPKSQHVYGGFEPTP